MTVAIEKNVIDVLFSQKLTLISLSDSKLVHGFWNRLNELASPTCNCGPSKTSTSKVSWRKIDGDRLPTV